MLRGLVKKGMVTASANQNHTIKPYWMFRTFSTGLGVHQQNELDDKTTQMSATDSSSRNLETSSNNEDQNDIKASKSASDSAPTATAFMKGLIDPSSISHLTSNPSKPSTVEKAKDPQDWNQVIQALERRNGIWEPTQDPKLKVVTSNKEETLELQFEELWRHRQARGPVRPAKPSDGRMVNIQGDGDVARAYGILNSILSKNNVRHELRLGDRYEKPNQLRRRLKSERHRRRFADAVRQKVKLVMELKSRGA